jgi:Mu-like prophage major head subunit gpT
MELAFINASNTIPKQFPKLFNEWDTDPRRAEATIEPIAELGLFRGRTEGGAFAVDSPSELIPITFTYSTYGLSTYVTEEGQLEDPLNLMGMLPQMLANSERYTQDITIWNTFNYAFSSTAPGSDGLPLCSTAHPLGPIVTATGVTSLTGLTFSNYLGTAPLTPESFRQAEILFETLLTDRGLPDRRTPKFLVCGPQLAKTAQEVLGARLAPYTTQNQPNTAADQAEIMVVRYITSNTAWWLCAGPGDWAHGGDCNSLVVGFKWQSRVHAWYDNPTGNYGIRDSYRNTFGFVNWRGIVGSSGS